MDNLLGRRQREVESERKDEVQKKHQDQKPSSADSGEEKKELVELRRQREAERKRKATAKRPMTIHVTVEAYEALQDLYFTSRTDKTNLVEEALRNYFQKRSKDVDGFDWDPYEPS